MEYALQLLISMLLGYFIGSWLDQQTGQSPWFTLAGLILGMVLGMGILYKRAMLKQEEFKRKQQAKKKDS